MLRTNVCVVFVLALLAGMGGASAWAAEVEGPAAAVSAPLPFLADQEPGCAAVSADVRPALAEIMPASTSADAICTGCSGHNCFFQAVGTVCLVDGRRGRCTEHPRICPEIKEVTCFCVAP